MMESTEYCSTYLYMYSKLCISDIEDKLDDKNIKFYIKTF